MKLTFVAERETKNTIRFQEQSAKLDAPVIGILYVQKHGLKSIHYKEGDKLIVTLEVEG